MDEGVGGGGRGRPVESVRVAPVRVLDERGGCQKSMGILCRRPGRAEALETGEGEQVPPPRRPHPPWRYPHGPVHGEIPEKSRMRLPTGYTPDTAAPMISPRTDPAPKRGGGGAPKARVGWGLPARSKMVGVWETGEGERVPPPRQPHPPWRYSHGPQHGEILEKSRIRLPTGSTPDTAAPLISPRTDPAPKVRQEAETWIASCYSLRSGYPYRSMHSW